MPECFYNAAKRCGATYSGPSPPAGWRDVTCSRCHTILGHACPVCSQLESCKSLCPSQPCVPSFASPSTSAGGLDDTRAILRRSRRQGPRPLVPVFISVPPDSPSDNPPPAIKKRESLLSRYRTVIWAVLCVMAVGGILAAVIVWNNALQLVKSEARANADREVKLQNQQRINRRLMQMRDSSTKSLTSASLAVSTAFQKKEKLNADDVKFVNANLQLFKAELAMGNDQLDAIEQDARKNLDGELLQQTLGDIDSSRAHLNLLERTHGQFEAQVQQVFGNPADKMGKGGGLHEALKDAYKQIEEALKKLNDEKRDKP